MNYRLVKQVGNANIWIQLWVAMCSYVSWFTDNLLSNYNLCQKEWKMLPLVVISAIYTFVKIYKNVSRDVFFFLQGANHNKTSNFGDVNMLLTCASSCHLHKYKPVLCSFLLQYLYFTYRFPFFLSMSLSKGKNTF